MLGLPFVFQRDRFDLIYSTHDTQENEFRLLGHILEGFCELSGLGKAVETPMKIHHALVLGRLVRFIGSN